MKRFRVSVEVEALTPREAATTVWVDLAHRAEFPSRRKPPMFTVTGIEDSHETIIDLSAEVPK